ncbi:MAG: alpha/beta fold hydrolase [Chromatiaceae bacterium]|jgi:pimeloyl-ACP methyl ester carboxylesterase/class 3 adenylate cyclase
MPADAQSPLALTPPVTAYTKTDDIHIAYQTVGEGDLDLIVAPGFVSHLDLQWTMPGFANFVRGLNRFARVILFDKRGTGLSDPAADADRFDRRMHDILAVMDAVGTRQAVLFGISEGGPLAALFAASHPQRVRALVLYGTFARGAVVPPDLIARFEEAIDHWGDGRTAEIFVSPSGVGAVVKHFTGLFERASMSPGLARALLNSIVSCDVRDVLPAIKVPTLVIHRLEDPFARAEWGRELAAGITEARYLELPGPDHIPWLGDSNAVIGAVEEFLTGHQQADTATSLLGTVLFTDIVGSTAHAARLGDEAWASLLDRHNNLVRAGLSAFDGIEIDRAGDGFFAYFRAPAKGVECARWIVEAVRPLGIELRAGLHTGELQVVDVRGLAGMTVHIGARIGALAQPGQVLVSRAVANLCTGAELDFRFAGYRRLKGVPDNLELVEAVPAAEPSPARHTRRALGWTDRASLAVARLSPGLLRQMARFAGAGG